MKTCHNHSCCRHSMHRSEPKTCGMCGKGIKGGNCKLCNSCSARENVCGHCQKTYEKK